VSLIGVAEEHPLDPATWSGSSAYFFGALAGRGLLAGAESAEPAKWLQRLIQLRNAGLDLERWKFRYHLDTALYAARTRALRGRISALRSDARGILQIGAVLDATALGLPVFSYHDGNLARRLDSPFGYPKISRSIISRALDYERRLYARVDLIFTMSEWLADSFAEDFGVDRRRIVPVYAGINMPDVHAAIPFQAHSQNILYVGKQFERKGGPLLLAAFRRVRRVLPKATLTIVGPTLSSPEEGVVNPGFVSKQTRNGLAMLTRFYESCTVFVLPTLYEPFGVSLVEAMAHARPCIGSRICAVPEIIQHERTGILVEPGDERALADAMLDLLTDPTKARAMGEEGYRRYRDQFTWSKVAERVDTHVRARLAHA
jgi:glycosyltransferase involved in cell wall biosynthesis